MLDHTHQRFRATRAGSTVELYGALNDTTTFQCLRGLITEDTVLSCAGLTQVSWIGLASFYRYLCDYGFNRLSLVKIPLLAYRYLKLLPDFGKKILIGSYEVETYDPALPMQTSSTLYIDNAEIERQATAQGLFLKGPGGPLAMPASYYAPSLFRGLDTQVEVQFWLAYTSFAAATIGLTASLMQNVQSGIDDLVARIQQKVSGAETGLAVVAPAHFERYAELLGSLREHIDPECTRIVQRIDAVARSCDTISRRLLTLAASRSPASEAYTVLRDLHPLLGRLQECAGELESVGVNTGDRVLSLRVASVLKNVLATIDHDRVTPEALAKIRDAFVLMDFTTADSWIETKAEILVELEQIDGEIGKCVLLLQGFDLSRQVIEHRLKEAAYLAAALPAASDRSKPWQEVRDALVQKVRETMVTDQEKQACEFYLLAVGEQAKGDDCQGAGDMLLF